MKTAINILTVLLLSPFFAYSQTSKDNQNITKYFESTYEFLNYLLDDIDKFTVIKLPEDISVGKILNSKGLNVRLNIERHQPDLKNYFLERGIDDTNSISLIVITTYVRHLKNEPLEIDEEIDFILKLPSLIEDHGDYLLFPERKPSTKENNLLEFYPIGQHIRSKIPIVNMNDGYMEIEEISLISEIVEYLDNGRFLAIIIDILNPENKPIEYKINDTIEGYPIHYDLVPILDK